MPAKTDTSNWKELGVIDRYQTGETTRDIASFLGVSKAPVAKYLKSQGVTLRRGKEKATDFGAVVEDYLGGMSIHAIAAKVGCRTPVISSYLTEQGVIISKAPKSKVTVEQYKAIAEDYIEGISVGQIAEKYGVTKYYVREAARQQGVLIRTHNGPPRACSKEQIESILSLSEEGFSEEKISVALKADIGRITAVIKSNHYSKTAIGIRRIKSRGDGYIQESVSLDDPLFGMANSSAFAPQHRLVMARHLERPLTNKETVHHINGIRNDNRIENLQLRQGNHGQGAVNVCLDCGSYNLGHEEL